MRKSIFLALLIITTTILYAQKSIKKTEIEENGFSVEINYKLIVNKISDNGVDYEITPISADKLNNLFLNENMLNGIFEYSHYENNRSSYFIKKRKKKVKQ